MVGVMVLEVESEPEVIPEGINPDWTLHDQALLLVEYEELCDWHTDEEYEKGIQKYCVDECSGTSSDCVCRNGKEKYSMVREDGFHEYFCYSPKIEYQSGGGAGPLEPVNETDEYLDDILTEVG